MVVTVVVTEEVVQVMVEVAEEGGWWRRRGGCETVQSVVGCDRIDTTGGRASERLNATLNHLFITFRCLNAYNCRNCLFTNATYSTYVTATYPRRSAGRVLTRTTPREAGSASCCHTLHAGRFERRSSYAPQRAEGMHDAPTQGV